MASVSPSDSVSQGNGVSNVSDESCLQSPGQLSEILAAAANLGLSESMMKEVLAKWSGAYHAYLRKYESVGSVTSSAATTLSAVSADSSDRPRSVESVFGKKKRRGRRKSVPSSAVSKSSVGRADPVKARAPSDVGYCYLMVVRVACREQVASLLGAFPTFRALLLQPAGFFVSEWSMASMKVQVESGLCHLRGAGPGYPLCQVLGSLARKVAPVEGSLASVVLRWDVGELDCESPGVGLDNVLGADDSGLGVARTVLNEKIGFGHLDLFQTQYREPVVALLGSSPYVSDLLTLPRSWYSDGLFESRVLQSCGDLYRVVLSGADVSLSELATRRTYGHVDRVYRDVVRGLQSVDLEVTSGYSYLTWVCDGSRTYVASLLGPYPRFSALLAQPAEIFDMAGLDRARMSCVYGGLWSVFPRGTVKLAEFVASVGFEGFIDYSPFSLAKLLMSDGERRSDLGQVSVFDRVGGRDAEAWFDGPGYSYLRFINLRSVEQCKRALGPYVKVQQLIDMPGGWLDLAATIRLRIVEDSGGNCGVEFATQRGALYSSYVRNSNLGRDCDVRFL